MVLPEDWQMLLWLIGGALLVFVMGELVKGHPFLPSSVSLFLGRTLQVFGFTVIAALFVATLLGLTEVSAESSQMDQSNDS